eukprot:6194132-Pleurochrysis_carterae.AAC.12
MPQGRQRRLEPQLRAPATLQGARRVSSSGSSASVEPAWIDCRLEPREGEKPPALTEVSGAGPHIPGPHHAGVEKIVAKNAVSP